MTTSTANTYQRVAGLSHPTRTEHTDRNSGTTNFVASNGDVRSPRSLARIAGVLYLLVGVLGGFALAFVYPKLYVDGDASATAANVAANSELLRVAIPANLIQAAIWVILAVTLSRMLQHVNRTAAATMVVLAAIGAGITMLNELFGFEALRVVTGEVDMTSLGSSSSNALVLLLLDAQHYGVLIAQIFMGLWLVPLGYLAYKSGWFPKTLGILLVVACFCYLVGTLAAFLLPNSGQKINTLVTMPCGVAEIWMVVALLVIGVKTVVPTDRRQSSAVAS
jgi:hypothetical protein